MNSQNLTTYDATQGIPTTVYAEHSGDSKPDVTLDLGSLRCPMFGLKSMIALGRLEPGQTIEIATTNSRARKVLGRVSRMTKTQLIADYDDHGQSKHLLRKEFHHERDSGNLRS